MKKRAGTDELVGKRPMSFRDEFDALPPSLRRVALAVPSGKNQNQMACELGISYGVLKNQLKRIYQRLDLSTAHELAVRMARECPDLLPQEVLPNCELVALMAARGGNASA
jgi:DNA-binding NarL/FixJ family response regulator